MTKLLLCWFYRTKLRQDNALLWDVRLCCKRCFLEQLEAYNKKLNKLADNGLKQELDVSGDKV